MAALTGATAPGGLVSLDTAPFVGAFEAAPGYADVFLALALSASGAAISTITLMEIASVRHGSRVRSARTRTSRCSATRA